MTFVCLSNLAGPTGEANPAELAPGLLLRAPRVFADRERGLIWADARGLPAEPLARALLALLREAGVAAPRAGIARVPVAAEAAAAVGRELVTVAPGGERAFLAPFPAGFLRPSPPLARAFEVTGLATCGALACLDRGAVEVRFGAEGAALWRLARGVDPRRPFPPALPPLPAASLGWADYALRDPERLLFVINRLVAGVCAELAERGLGARAFTLTFELAGGGAATRPFHPSRATANPRTWLRLIREALEQIRLPDAVAGLGLRTDAAAPPDVVQGDLLDRGFATADRAEQALAQVLDEDAALLVPDNSRHPLLRRRTTWRLQPSTVAWRRTEAPLAPAPRPDDAEAPVLTFYLRPEPEPVEVETVERRDGAAPIRYRDRAGWHELLVAPEPDCVSGGQWEAEPHAVEQFRCVSADGGVVLLTRDARSGSWRLDGEWR